MIHGKMIGGELAAWLRQHPQMMPVIVRAEQHGQPAVEFEYINAISLVDGKLVIDVADNLK